MASQSISNRPGEDELYLMWDPMASRAFRGAINYERVDRLMRGEVQLTSPVRVTPALGTQLLDVIWTTHASGVLISKRLIDLFDSEGVTGWSTYPVVVTDRHGAESEDWSGLAITGRCGPIEEWRGTWAWKRFHGKTVPVLTGLLFDQSTWDGSDFFMPADHTGYRYTSSRVRSLFRANKLRNVQFVPASEFELNETIVDPKVPRPSKPVS